jgi:hypothetical protein
MGLFTRFESGGRTDAILRQNNGNDVALLEWEWTALHFGNQKINDIEKLKAKCKEAASKGKPVQFAGFFGYSRHDVRRHETDFGKLSQSVLEGYTKRWGEGLPLLLVVLVHFKWMGSTKGGREFGTMTFDVIQAGQRKRLREQPAHPWDVPGSRWEHKEGAPS